MADDPPSDLGDAIKKSVVESFRNMDPIDLMQKIVADTPEDEESLEIREKIAGVMAKFDAMSDGEKESFIQQMKDVLASKVQMKIGDHNLNLDGLQEGIQQAIVYRLVLLGVGVLFLVLLFVFFGYKLFKSIKEKELRREEKKKQKQMKKKK